MNDPALFVDRLYSAVTNLAKQTDLNEIWIRDAYTAQAVVEIVVDDIVGGLFATVMEKLEMKLDRAENRE
ncbi:hypothetical protein AURDEDRAFT_173647 [Auricularia subglabra TFB-10046 SS5]|nr:hypothetical protein AURDEDRAFT_173647 [Auricularia subglabra TFB-10046 SS5]